MKINMETDYAFRIMRCIAEKNYIIDAKSISEIVEVPIRFTLKILGKLVSGGIVISHKGSNGGYKLALAADQITLRQILEIIEGPIVISKCLSDDFICKHDEKKNTCGCFFNKVFDEINITIAKKLDSVTIADSIK